MIDWTPYLDIALKAVEAGSEVLQSHILQGFELKEDHSPVTQADKLTEQAIRDVILPALPECGFIGEEFEATRPNARLIWYCDPIDGTWSYLNREHTACISLGLFENGEPRVSVIYNPFTKELYHGIGTGTALVNAKKMPQKQVIKLEDALINFHISCNNSQLIKELYDSWAEERFAKLVSMGGSIAYAFAKVAEGVHHICISKGNKASNIWDLGSGIHLIKSVGGIVTSLDGEALYQYPKGKVVVASLNPQLHKEALKLLKELEN